MGKKVINWIGLGLLLLYFSILFFICYGIHLSFIGDEEYAKSLVTCAFVLIICGGIFLPPLYKHFGKKAVYRALSNIRVPATVISKTHYSGGHYLTAVFIITFELQDGSRITFPISNGAVYNVILEGESGILTYRANKKHLFFVDFEWYKE